MNKYKIILTLLCFGIVRAQDQPETALGIQWQEVQGNPILVGGPCLSWTCAGVSDPTMVQDGSGNLQLWFTSVGVQQNALTKGLVAEGPYVGKATKSVQQVGKVSLASQMPDVPVGPPGAWDRYVETPTVRYNYNSSLLTMWYTGYATSGFVAPAIGQMTSTDSTGTAWNHPDAPIYRPSPKAWDGSLVTGPTVVQGPDGIWRLYYTGLGTKDGIGLLTSEDGVTWTPNANNPVMEAQPGAWDDQILEQTVAYFNGRYWMWYSGYQGSLQASTSISIGLATSMDGMHWTRYSGNPVIQPGAPGSWNDLRVLAPDVIVEPDGSLLLVAYGQSHRDIGKTAGSIGLWRSR